MKIFLKYTSCICTEFREPQLFIARNHNREGFLDCRRFLILLNDRLGAIDGGKDRASAKVKPRDMNVVGRQHIDQVGQPARGIGRVAAIGKSADQFLKTVKGLSGGLRISLGEIFSRESREQIRLVVKVDQAFEIQNVVNPFVVWIQLGETVNRR